MTNEWDTLLSSIVTALWGYRHSPSQQGLFSIGTAGVILDRDPKFTGLRAVALAGNQTYDEVCLPSSDRWASKEDSQELEADFALPTV